MSIRFYLSLATSIFLGAAGARAGQMALVGDEVGHAVLVQHRGKCYAVLPDHVAVRDRMPLISALPQVSGMAVVFHRLPEIDLALAYVEGDLAASCELQWPAMSRDISRMIATRPSGGLSRIQYGGQFIDRAEATIVDADDTHFVIATTEEWATGEIMGGVSGALFFLGETPVGIALTSENTRRARFLRMDRVYAALTDVLSTGHASAPARLQIAGAQDGLGYRITSQNRIKDGVRKGLDEAFDATWDGAQIEIEFTLSNDLPIRLGQILIETNAADQTVTFPQQVRLELDRGGAGQPFWREIFAPDMSPNGLLDVPTGQTVARRVRLTVHSVWHPDRPMRIDRVVFR